MHSVLLAGIANAANADGLSVLYSEECASKIAEMAGGEGLCDYQDRKTSLG